MYYSHGTQIPADVIETEWDVARIHQHRNSEVRRAAIERIGWAAYTVTADDDEVRWDCAVPDNDIARAVLDEFYALPDTLHESLDGIQGRLAEHGLVVISDAAGTVRTVQPAEQNVAAQAESTSA